jgi:hypothetical protein
LTRQSLIFVKPTMSVGGAYTKAGVREMSATRLPPQFLSIFLIVIQFDGNRPDGILSSVHTF